MASSRRWRLFRAATLLIALGVLVATTATDLQAHARDRHEHTALTAAYKKLAASKTTLAETSYGKALTTNRRNALQAFVTSTLGTLAATNAKLLDTDVYAYLQGSNIKTLQTCLGGVQSSFQQIAGNNNNRAAQDISAVSGACLSLAGQNSDGLVYPFDFPDPDILLVGGTYFGYATNSVGGNIQIIESTDLTHWTAVGNALPSLPAWATPDATWAPAVAQIGGSFDLYYAAEVAGPGGGEECISVATSSQPQGPFVDTSSAPLECQRSLNGSIDPSLFVDTDGNLYLLWKSNGGVGAATIWSEQLNPAGTGFVANTTPTQLLVPDQPWEAGVIEAPDLVTSGGRYFLFYSGNNWNSADYAVGVATCTGPLGPCIDTSPQPILASSSVVDGPGGESVFTDASGSFWIAFHAWIPGAVGYPHGRDLFIRRLDLTGAVPAVEAAG